MAPTLLKSYEKLLEFRTPKRNISIDITEEVNKIILESGVKDGIVIIFVPHTTCGITINENWDRTVQEDIQSTLSKIAPPDEKYLHTEGNADSHIKTAIMGNSICLPLSNSSIPYGTWQGIFLMEFDGPRKRKVIIKVIGE